MTENERLTINGKEITLYREVETNLYRFSKDAVDMLLEVLEEREQYRAIGTIAEFKALKEKSVGKKAILSKSMMTKKEFQICPVCERLVLYDGIKFNYCQHCGQKLDWE